MKKGINVLSLFDGMSCGQIALERANVEVNKYFASEIKPHAIEVTQYNYPNTIQVGDITKLKYSGNYKIDLLIGGSPCQDFSQANKIRVGLQGTKSGLFYEYVRLLKECEPTYFLLENVKMKKEHQDIISGILGVEPININSKLVSAQMRNRLYWTNIPNVTVPKKVDIKLSDILTSGYTNKDKAYCLLESESRPQKTNWKRFRRWRKKGFVNIVFEREDLNLFHNRILNQTELERLQTVPDGYTKILNRNESACLLGDGWTVDIIAHILKNINVSNFEFDENGDNIIV
jgi:DNA (cytosine-5)-methyltransferase 3A